jgi:ATP-dependent DNA ligase
LVNHTNSAPAPLIYADHIDGNGTRLFQLACEEDMEGIVAKRKDGLYASRIGATAKLKEEQSYSRNG